MKGYVTIVTAFLLFSATAFIESCYAQTPTLWGITSVGGQNNLGTIFSYDLNTGSYAVWYSFDSASGINPTGSLLQASDGYLYGMTNAGGTYNSGTIFSFNISADTFKVVHNLGNPNDSDGIAPWGSLFQADNGLLYGMTQYGGVHNNGIVFSYNIFTDAYTHVHNFGQSEYDGFGPYGSIMQASNGLIYGMTSEGGEGASGVIFSYDYSTNTYRIVYNFGFHHNDGVSPLGTLVQANDSLLLGLTYLGNINGGGTIFSYNIYTDSEYILYNFSIFLKGQAPRGSLAKANNGLFYGTTYDGGYDSVGVIFDYDIIADTVADMHDFGSNKDGVNPFGSLLQASNGLLYGTTGLGGDYDSGTLFSYNIANGEEVIVHSFSGRNDGFFQVADVIEVDFPTGFIQLSSLNAELKIYPNPTANTLTGTINSNSLKTSGKIIAPDGRVLLDNILMQQGRFEIDVSGLSAGVYLLEVTNERKRLIRKFVKQ